MSVPEPASYAEILRNGFLLGRDFQVAFGDSRIERCLLIAPHGGGIEPGTSEIMRAVAQLGGWAWYEFAGFLPRGNKEALHIASVSFDEPTLMALLPKAGLVMAFHGASQTGEPVANVGGLWAHGRQTVIGSINAAAEEHGITAIDAAASASPQLRGADSASITNRGRTSQGVQIEFSRGARNLLFPPDASREVRGRRSARLRPLAQAIHNAIKQLSAMGARQ